MSSTVGTAAQATKLASLAATKAANRATYDAAVASLKTAQKNMINADRDFTAYQNYYFGNAEHPNFVDDSNTDV